MASELQRPFVLIDSREQQPYEFPQGWPTLRKTLATADYSILGHEDRFGIERKSLPDLLGCIFTDRFRRELERLKTFTQAFLVIEANLWKIRHHRHYKGNPESVIGALQMIPIRYGVQVLYLDDRETAQAYVWGLLEKYQRHLLRELKEKTDDKA